MAAVDQGNSCSWPDGLISWRYICVPMRRNFSYISFIILPFLLNFTSLFGKICELGELCLPLPRWEKQMKHKFPLRFYYWLRASLSEPDSFLWWSCFHIFFFFYPLSLPFFTHLLILPIHREMSRCCHSHKQDLHSNSASRCWWCRGFHSRHYHPSPSVKI